MRSIFKVIKRGFITAWDGLWLVWVAEVFWLLCCLPLVTIPLAFGGLYYTMDALATGESVDWRTFFSGMRLHVWSSLRWGAFNLIALALLGFDIWFFSATKGDFGQTWGQIISGVLSGLLLLWLLINMYTFPLMLVQEKPSYRLALRNAAVFYMKWPGYTLVFTLINLAIIALSIWLNFIPFLILGASLPALLACVCVRAKIEETHSMSSAG